MSIEDYKIMSHEFRVESKGKDIYGRLVKHPIETYETKMGSFSPERWEVETEKAIFAADKGALLDNLEKYCSEHCRWLKPKEIRHYAMKCLVHGSYLHWNDFNGKERKDKELG